jgi:outer membrane protein TolC
LQIDICSYNVAVATSYHHTASKIKNGRQCDKLSKFSGIVHRSALVILIILTAHPCRADFLDYRNIVTDSISYSASLRVKMQDVLISDAEYRSNFAGLYPEINVSGRSERYENLDHRNNADIHTIGNEVIGGSQSAWRTSLYLSGQYYISHWYKKTYEAKYYEKLRDSSIHECETEVKKMITDVTDIFRSIVEGKIKLNYADKILARLNEISRLKKEAFASGQFAYEEVLKAETDAVNMEKDITGIKKDLKESFENLSNYTGKSYSEDMEFITLPPNGQLSIADETRVIAGSPEYKARQKELEAIRFKEKFIGNNFLPDISVYGRYDLYNSNPNSMGESFNDVRPTDYSVGVLISLPLFDGGVRKWEREKALHEIKKSEESARLVFNEKNKNIKTLQSGYVELSKSYAYYKKLNEQYKKIMDISKKAQLLGERSKIDITELEKDALIVERDLKIVEHTIAVYEKQLSLELNFNEFVGDYGGDRTCKY